MKKKHQNNLFMKVLIIGFDQFIDHDLVHCYGIDLFSEPFISMKSKIYLKIEYSKFQALGLFSQHIMTWRNSYIQ